MKKFSILAPAFLLAAVILTSCSSNKMALNNTQDNLYFMASDARVATKFAVQNNNPEQFESLSSLQPEAYSQENFSSRNVNPDYISRYQTETVEGDEGVVYFDESGIDENQTSQGDINAYNNYRVSGSGVNSGFNPSMSFNMGMMYGMGMMNPYGMAMFNYPFWGFGSGFSMSIGIGFGFGYPMYGYPMYGYPMYGYPVYAGRPIYVLPGGEYGDRRVVSGARPTRGSSFANASGSTSNAAIQPSPARAQARREVLNNGTSTRTSLTNNNNARTTSRDFGSSQNDYYSNSRSRVATNGTTRNAASPAMDRSVTRTRSAMPSARPSAIPSNSRSYTGPSRSGATRSSSPSYNTRSSSPSYNRSSGASRSGYPTYNSGQSNSRTYSTPSRSSSPSNYSTPSRSSSGGGMSSGGGASRSSGGGGASSGGSRGGRGN